MEFYRSIEAIKSESLDTIIRKPYLLINQSVVIEVSDNEFEWFARVTMSAQEGNHCDLSSVASNLNVADYSYDEDYVYSQLITRKLKSIASIHEVSLAIAENENRARRLLRCFNIGSIDTTQCISCGVNFKGLHCQQLD